MSRHSALAPFRIRSFRFQWPADLLTSWSFEMEALVLGWYILVETGSVVLLTLFAALQFGGTVIAPMFGVASDRIGHRNLLSGMRAVYAIVAAALMTLAFAGVLEPLLVFVLVAITGIVRSSDMGLRGALIAETMPFDRLTSAMSISRTTSDSARIAGALAGAGMFAAFGIGPAYIAVTAFYVLSAVLTWCTVPAKREPAATGDAAGAVWELVAMADLREGIVHVWNTPSLLALMWLAFLFNLTAFPDHQRIAALRRARNLSRRSDRAWISGGEPGVRRAARVARIDAAPARSRELPRLMIVSAAGSGMRCFWLSRRCRACSAGSCSSCSPA